MYATAIGIVFLLILVFLIITWSLWVLFLWSSKLYYEISQTNFSRVTIRTSLNHSAAYIVQVFRMVHGRVTNRIPKMNRNTIRTLETILLIILVVVSFAIGYSRGYGNGYKACSVNYGLSE
jgi:hypothetical protein